MRGEIDEYETERVSAHEPRGDRGTLSVHSFSVVVCTRDRPEKLRRCLDSIAALDYADFEILIVDNGTGDPAPRRIADEFEARIVLEPIEGLSRARNAGAVAARGDLIAFIDDDATAVPDWLTHHSELMEDPAIVATTGRVVPADAARPGVAAYTDLGTKPFRVDRHSDAWFERANFGGVGIGVNMVFRRALFENGWRFHEALGRGGPIPGAEENYAFFSLMRDGYAVGYAPDAVVRHETPPTDDGLRLQLRQNRQAAAAYALMLAVDEPGFRRHALRYVVQGFRGHYRSWRPPVSHGQPERENNSLSSAFSGGLAYLRNRRAVRRSRPPRARL